ncbi:MAG: hypothetical protein HN580_02245 [Deltaproteobacteria bacterium]|nr:hypothetical protein [Deltaproteobacteria bacterium]MBT4267422.1 hypothetical protein [Deltaproteobacteria bacterium]MBT4640880.1 hypothetical protein [Deltaproteobacteria bacterium]MBT6503175.1 hypothetical protein [Deltaproteobacteria bacterium]MBT6612370.1 hypothetical protein [Deltaproteobacteria bacterium]
MTLKTILLVLMLVIPFFLYAAAAYGSTFQTNLLLILMIGNMLVVLKKG